MNPELFDYRGSTAADAAQRARRSAGMEITGFIFGGIIFAAALVAFAFALLAVGDMSETSNVQRSTSNVQSK